MWGGSRLGFALGLLMLCAASTFIQHALLGTRFLEGRTAMVFLPIFSLLIVQWIAALWEFGERDRPGARRSAQSVCLVLAVALLAHTLRTANLRESHEWPVGLISATICVLIPSLFHSSYTWTPSSARK